MPGFSFDGVMTELKIVLQATYIATWLTSYKSKRIESSESISAGVCVT